MCADADVLHHRVRRVVDPFAAIRNDGFVREVTAPSNESTRSVTVTTAPAEEERADVTDRCPNARQLAGRRRSHTFGYLSLGAVATVPLVQSMSYGAWVVHGGFEFQSLGDTPEAFNRGDQSKIIGTIGIGFSY